MSRVPLALALALLTACDASVASVSTPSPAGARTLEPGCSGSGFATIQSAIAAAAAGDVLEICAGVYPERLVVSGKRLTLVAKPGATVVVDAQGLGKGLVVSSGAEVTVQGLTVRNGSGGNGGNVSCAGASLDLVDARLEGGVATNGGGLYVSDCAGTASGTTFDGNRATSGGGAYVTGDRFGFEGDTFVRNDATGIGGGVRLRGDGPIVANVFEANHAGTSGGGVYALEDDGTIEGNHVEANSASADGGGIYVEFGLATIRGNTFLDNDAADEGGGLRVKTASPTILDNDFVGNHASWRGGGSRISHDEAVLAGNVWTGNSASRGGALMLYESASTLSDETFTGNRADRGGALYIEAGWGGPTVEDSLFDGNSAAQGGQLYVALPGETTTLRRVDFVNGVADAGGALYATGSTLDLRNVLFAANHADVAGGGLFLDATSGVVSNAIAWANTAPDGAGLVVQNGSALDVVNTTFGRNRGGAALDVNSGTAPTVRYSNFNGNSSSVSGMPGVIGLNGNFSASPLFTAPSSGDFTLQPGSPLVDAGDPTIADRDGTRSDIGVYGGPDAP